MPSKRRHKRARRPQPAIGPTPQPTRGRRDAWLVPLGVSAAALGVFIATLAPTVTAEDSGELIAAAWHFGVPHPPGYPLWTMLCGLFIRVVQIGSIAWRANLFSAVCSAAAAGLACAALQQLKLWWPACAAAALVWVWSRWSWSQSVITEVYPLNSTITAGMLWCTLRWYSTQRHRLLSVAALLWGLGMGNHHLVALTAVTLVVWIIGVRPQLLLRGRLVLVSVCLFAAGLLTYAYLPLRALTDPPMNWGDPSTPPRLYNHVTRSQYGAFGPMKAEEPRSLARFGRQLEYIGRSAIDDLTVPLFAAALAGIVVLLFQDRRIFLLVALWLVWNGPLFALMANFGFDRTAQWSHRVFLIPMMLGLAIPIAYLLDFIQRGLSLVLPGEQRMALAIGFLPALAAPATLLAANWGRCDYSNYWYAYDHGRNLLDSTLPGAMIFPSGDHNTFPLAYLTQVENVRPDVLIADIYGYVTPELYADRPGNSEATPEVWLINHQRRPAYFTTKKSLPVDKASMVVSGLLYHLLPDHIPFDETGLRELNRYRNLEDPGVIDLGASHILADHHFYKGWYALKDNDLETALRHFRQAAGFGHGIREVFNNIGSALGEHGHADLAQDYFLRAAEIDRHYTMPRWNLFRAYRNQREFDKACDMLEQLIEADPNDPRPYGEMGFIQNMHYRDTAAAVKYWRLSLERHPAQPQIIEALRQAGQAVQAPPERP